MRSTPTGSTPRRGSALVRSRISTRLSRASSPTSSNHSRSMRRRSSRSHGRGTLRTDGSTSDASSPRSGITARRFATRSVPDRFPIPRGCAPSCRSRCTRCRTPIATCRPALARHWPSSSPGRPVDTGFFGAATAAGRFKRASRPRRMRERRCRTRVRGGCCSTRCRDRPLSRLKSKESWRAPFCELDQ